FWSFQGSAIDWGKDYIFPISDGFAQDNWMGLQPDSRTGGGVPVVDLWTKKMGLAIAHIEPVPKLISLPVEVQSDKKLKIAVRNDLNKILPPQTSYTTLKTIVITHSLDYFNALSTYSKLITAQGLQMKKPSDEAYEAIWCGWGYESDFTIDDILGTIPKLKEFGIHWVVIDDRWFDRYGDWNVRTDNFPEGEAQIKALVDTLHKQGFKVKIWWNPTTAQSADDLGDWPSATPGISDVAKNHPDWLIMDENGNYPQCGRKMYFFCPSIPAVQDYIRNLTIKFIKDWGFDGHKLDAFWTVPPCYNPKHHHKYPAESHEDLPQLLRIIYETTKSLKSNSVTEICNCGTTQDFWQAQYIDQPVTSDPVGSWQVRKRIKVFKALMGPKTAAYADHVELTEIKFLEDIELDIGRDFASAVGTGGVVGTKFTWPGGP
ncbi:MAG: alpha-galactosidase, partial [bacterium]